MSENTASRIITLASYPQAIVHIDCDAFFASCEQARDPRLKGRPVATGKERGIVSCASYEAKASGVERGMRLFEARERCPGIILLPSDYETYSLYSERLFAIIRRFTPDVEGYSIDEAFCDITGLRRIYRRSYSEIARMIKQRAQKELGITVSAGLSLSKTLAKLCSKHRKPDGFTAVPGYRLHEFLKGMPLERVCGFGDNTVQLLSKCGVRSVLDYVERPVDFAQKLLGKIGAELWRELRGEAVYALSTAPKERYLSISKSKTFMPASGARDFVKAQLVKNLESACIKLRRHGLAARTLAVYLRMSDFRHTGIEARFNRHSSATMDFTGVCAELFEAVFKPGLLYRASGVILSDIVPEGVDARTLFDDPIAIEKKAALSRVIDEVNHRFGKHTLHIAASSAAMGASNNHPRNDIAWRKQELLKGETFRRRLGIPLLK